MTRSLNKTQKNNKIHQKEGLNILQKHRSLQNKASLTISYQTLSALHYIKTGRTSTWLSALPKMIVLLDN